MRILFVHTRYFQNAGGEDTTVEAEKKLMTQKGHIVDLLLFDNATMNNGAIGKLKTGLKSIYNPASAKLIAEKIESFRPDVVHVHNFFFDASPSVLIETNNRNIPLVVTIHNFRLVCANALLLRNGKVCELCLAHTFPWYGVKYKCYHDSALQSAAVGAFAATHKLIGTWKTKVDLYITPSAFSRQKLLASSLRLHPEKITVKHNFIDDPGEGDVSARKNFYLFVGRLSTEKGVSVLLEAWKDLQQELVILGEGPEEEKLRREYSGLKHVRFLGRKSREEVLAFMKECRALVFPSVWYEGLPLTIVEAFATGTPVIASSLGAMKEMITSGSNGMHFEAGNSQSIRQTILNFNNYLESGNREVYRNARSRYLKEYHPEVCYSRIMDIYNQVIDSKKI